MNNHPFTNWIQTNDNAEIEQDQDYQSNISLYLIIERCSHSSF